MASILKVYRKISLLCARVKGGYIKFKCKVLYGDRVQIGANFLIFGPLPLVKVSFSAGGVIKIGRDVSLVNSTRYNHIGVLKPTSIVANGGSISIGDHVGISGVSLYSTKSICIGDFTIIGANCTIMDTDFHTLDSEGRLKDRMTDGVTNISPIKSADVCIGRNVFIGVGSMILKGVSVGENAIIGAGVVVSHEIPSETVCVSAKNRLFSVEK